MTKERRNRRKKELLRLLQHSAKSGGENTRLQHLLTVSSENPEVFLEKWLRPLLAEGLDLDQAYDLVVEGALRPS